MDAYYQDYKTDVQYLDIDDFVFLAGATYADRLFQLYQQEYGRIRQSRNPEFVSFSPDLLVSKVVEIDENGFTQFCEKVLSFAYDQQGIGIQLILPVGAQNMQFERATLQQRWAFGLVPKTDRIFWYQRRNKEGKTSVTFYNHTPSLLKKVEIFYVPGIGPDMEIPDDSVDWVQNNTLQKMKAAKNDVVIKESIDNNKNNVLEGEINKTSIR